MPLAQLKYAYFARQRIVYIIIAYIVSMEFNS